MNLTTDSGGIGYTSGLGYTSVYYSFTLKLSDISFLPQDQSAASIIAGFTKIESHKNTTVTPNSIGAQLWIRSDGGNGFQLGFEGGSGANNVIATPVYDLTSHSVGETLFIVGAGVVRWVVLLMYSHHEGMPTPPPATESKPGARKGLLPASGLPTV
jgi:hypothetical protein